MKVALDTGRKRYAFSGAVFIISALYLASCTRIFLADQFSGYHDLKHLRWAIRLAPGDAEYHEQLARYLLQNMQDPQGAATEFEAAARLNRNSAETWLGLAEARQIMGDAQGERSALENALAADPMTPRVAWRAAEFFLMQGDLENAFSRFKFVAGSDPGKTPVMLRMVLRATGDVNAVMRSALPAQPDAYFDLIDLLISKKDTEATIKVWNALLALGRPLEPRRAFEYMNYLIGRRQAVEADSVWRQFTLSSGYSSYLSSPNNLIVNPGFDLDILNNGFDWRYQQQAGVTLALDRNGVRSGQNSLAIAFEGAGVSDAGIMQLIPVQPGRSYEFSAYYKTGVIDGAGAPRFQVSDAYGGRTYFESDDLKNASDWREARGEFTTDSDTELLALRLARVPAGNPIRGKLWVGDFRLAPKATGQM
jgi:tetratricopeptide (TPR) repeat protein